MVVDVPQQKRRASGFRRVRNAHDLQPRVDIQPGGRRMGSDGVYLSVRKYVDAFMVFTHILRSPLGNLQLTFSKRITYATRSSDTNPHTTRAEC